MRDDVTHPNWVSDDPREPFCPLDHLPWRSLQGMEDRARLDGGGWETDEAG